eukprot:CAMPEP_0114983834 /NCGR_PEP_ID=MMETSP0216-20121206/6923_1 /TAXON_ID=223996 /ORGANISM="Protocruzia adherens, Strain Boccale" /LENGTH=270 /DNA_ID=CAMNT_0002345867 /DNA_START=144 /DNA_END=956 /DNA_ORIENTATION=-
MTNINNNNGLKVATFNIRNTTDRYSERLPLIQNCLRQVNADIIGLQEVVFRSGKNQVPALLEGYGTRRMESHISELQFPYETFSKTEDPEFALDGNLVLHDSSYPVLASSDIHIGIDRCAQKRLLKIDGHRVWMVNTHLHHLKEDFQIRKAQAEGLITWMELDVLADDAVFLTLDMNDHRDSSCYKLFIEAGFKSAYRTVNGDEPAFTFPTGLKAPYMDTDGHLSADYVFYRGPIKPVRADLFGNECDPNDMTIYPSDHYGIWADFEFTS